MLYLIVYFSRKIISIELNYNIYDKELLVIIEALRE
jgi:RNase H-like domain found in reverse transcriptase